MLVGSSAFPRHALLTGWSSGLRRLSCVFPEFHRGAAAYHGVRTHVGECSLGCSTSCIAAAGRVGACGGCARARVVRIAPHAFAGGFRVRAGSAPGLAGWSGAVSVGIAPRVGRAHRCGVAILLVGSSALLLHALLTSRSSGLRRPSWVFPDVSSRRSRLPRR